MENTHSKQVHDQNTFNQEIKIMQQGAYFVKHHRYTCPKLRIIWVTDDLKQICWSEPKNQKTKVGGFIEVKDIKSVKSGIQKAKSLPKSEQSKAEE